MAWHAAAERGEDFAVEARRAASRRLAVVDAFLDLAAETGVFLLQLANELAKRGRLHIELGLATGELVARPARGDDDFRQTNSFSSGIERRANFRR